MAHVARTGGWRPITDAPRKPGRPARRRCLALLCCLVAGGFAFAANAPQPTSPAGLEQRLKAVFLYKFADYVEWPERVFPRADTPVTIAVIGDEPLVAELTEVIKDRTLRGRSFEVRRLSDDSSVDGIHVLFVARAHDAALRRAAVASAPILVVTDSEGALNSGSTINFMVVDERVRFEVSVEDAERRGLKLSSRLLSVAQNVRTGKP